MFTIDDLTGGIAEPAIVAALNKVIKDWVDPELEIIWFHRDQYYVLHVIQKEFDGTEEKYDIIRIFPNTDYTNFYVSLDRTGCALERCFTYVYDMEQPL